MNPGDYPTKHNLLQARQGLALAKQGHGLMDKKHRVLLAELRTAKINLNEACALTERALEKSYHALGIAYMEMGRDAVERIRDSNHYSLAGTTASLDEAYFTWKEAKKALVIFADAQARVNRLTQNIHKLRKRAAALEKIIVPVYEDRIKYIQSQLDERGRDELVRLKVMRNSESGVREKET